MSTSRESYHHGRLADALEEAALHLLEQMPAAEISLREVARAANVSHNAPYHHFRDRLGLLKALAERSMDDLTIAVEHAIDGAGIAADARLRAGGAAYICFAVAHPHAFNVVYDPLVCVPTQPSEAMAPRIERLERVLADTVAATGLVEEAEVRALWGLVHGLGTLCAAGHFTEAEALRASDAAITRLLAGLPRE